jgi:anti-sigma regulatory factor (Ser/Thr protein kinase)
MLIDALDRWGYTPRRWRLGELAEATVLGDRERLDVTLDALLENAIAHTGTDDRIELSARIEDGHAVLAVADSGCGIPEADLERIFDRFARATPCRSREVGGSGLGLPVVEAIAEAHRGSVRVQSAVGSGSRFELVIPAAPASKSPRQALTAGHRSAGNPGRRARQRDLILAHGQGETMRAVRHGSAPTGDGNWPTRPEPADQGQGVGSSLDMAIWVGRGGARHRAAACAAITSRVCERRAVR